MFEHVNDGDEWTVIIMSRAAFLLYTTVSKMGPDRCIQAPPGIIYMFSQRENQANNGTLDWYQITASTSPPVHLMHLKQGSTAIYRCICLSNPAVCHCIIS